MKRGRARRRERCRQGRNERCNTKKSMSPLDTLRKGAMALFGATSATGLAGVAQAESPVERYSIDYNYSIYSEDPLEAGKGLPLAEDSRYEIEMQQMLVTLPVTGRIDLGIELTHETMSGASPWYTLPDAAGTPIQVMSGATIEEERNDLLVGMNYHYDDARLGISTGYSTENDYSSINLGFDGDRSYNEGNTTLSAGIGGSYDTIEPTDAALFTTRPLEEDKQSYGFNLGVSQLLGRKTAAQGTMSYRYSTGYLSDPYKQVFIVGGLFLPDNRPSQRHQLALNGRLRRHVEELDGSLHTDYQFYLDDWGVQSHTIELGWHQRITDSLHVIPSTRYYTQSEADFFVPFFGAGPTAKFYSSDYRLSSYGAITLGVTAEYLFRVPFTGDTDWRATVAYERYRSSSDLSFYDVSFASPGLVSYNLFTVGLGVKY